MGHDVKACRSCGAPIIWCVTENGRKMPLDARPLVAFRLDDGDPPKAALQSDPVYGSHFATCPNAAAHRKTR